MTEIEALITKTTTNWDGVQNMYVSSRFNWMDGWWIKEEDSSKTNYNKWVETDKPTDNRCFMNIQCPGDNCCGLYPDANNRRCMAKSAALVPITLGAVTLTPTCMPDDGDDAVPENAQDDISKGALSEASAALDTFAAAKLADAKTDAGYADMTAEEQTAWDAERTAEAAKRDELFTELKALGGYDDSTCDDACKAVFQAELLNWEKEVYEACAQDKK